MPPARSTSDAGVHLPGARSFGIDLAWSDRHQTALCALDEAGRLIDERLVVTDDEIVDWVAEHMDGPCVVAVDAPLRVPNETGRRPCEDEIHQEYGRRKAGAHASNRSLFLERFGRIRGEDLARRLVTHGFRDPWHADRRVLIEAFPHPALIEAFGLPERLLYKAKRGVGVAARRVGLRNLGRLLAALEHVEPPLAAPPLPIPESMRGRAIKAAEDTLDARVCAWIAAVWAHHGDGRVRLFGSSASGHIAVPVGRFTDEEVALDPIERKLPAQATAVGTDI